MSSTGPRKLLKGMTTATSGVLARFPWLLPVRNSRGLCSHSYFGPRTFGGSENQCHRSERILNQGFQRKPSQPEFIKNLLRKWSRFCKIFYKNNSISMSLLNLSGKKSVIQLLNPRLTLASTRSTYSTRTAAIAT